MLLFIVIPTVNFFSFSFIIDKSNKLVAHCYYVKSVRIQSFAGPHFPAFGLNTEIYSVSLPIQKGKIWFICITSKNVFRSLSDLYDDTFYENN